MGKLFSKTKHSKHSGQNSGFSSIDGIQKSQIDDYHRVTQREHSPVKMPGGHQHQNVHSEAVVSLATVQPGLCLSGSKDKTVALYDYQNCKVIDLWKGHEREVTKVCYGAACQGIFSASRDKTIKLWQRGNPNYTREFYGHDLVVMAVHINKDNSLLCSGSRDTAIKLWDVETGTCLRENKICQNLINDVKFVPDSHLIIQSGEDKEVRLFDVRTLNVIHAFPRKQYIQMACDVSTDGSYCLTCSNGFGGNGCEATLWDIRAMALVHEYKGHSEAVEACIFLPFQGRPLVATSSRDLSVRIWDRDTKACIQELYFSGSGPLTSIIGYEDY
ncbi:hypothetical protein ACJMK2_038767, partial [Sinanodonta woodiana]